MKGALREGVFSLGEEKCEIVNKGGVFTAYLLHQDDGMWIREDHCRVIDEHDELWGDMTNE